MNRLLMMKRIGGRVLLLVACMSYLAMQPLPTSATSAPPARVSRASHTLDAAGRHAVSSARTKEGELRSSYGALPLSFELNRGQTNGTVKFLARAGGYLVFLTPTESVMALESPAPSGSGKGNPGEFRGADENDPQPGKPSRAIVRITLEGANPAPTLEGLDELTSRSNYLSGPDPTQWRTDIPNYARVRYAQVYPGIDMVYHGSRRQLEYDFVVAPGADPSVIRLALTGIQGFDISAMGDLVLHTSQGDMLQSKPIAYQERNGTREQVSASYITKGASGIAFQLGDYDRARPLIIDPVLVYSTYLGGSSFDQGYAIAVDSLGSAYVTGKTAAADFPTTSGAFQTTFGGGDALFIAKLNPAGTALVYATFINGASGNGIAVDAAGNAYVTGEASTPNFPRTPGAFQTEPWGFDAFITKLNASGSALVYSARFGGNFDDFGRSIALDAAGNAYITGWTVCRAVPCTFPTVNAFQPNYGGGNNDAFVTKINSSGSALVYSTYLGGGQIINATDDWGEGIAVDSAGSAYVTGYTYSPDFPVTPGAYDTSRAGLDAFVTKFTPNGNLLVYSTFLGAAGRDQGQSIAVDATGNAYVTGLTESSDNPFTSEYDGFPVTPGAFRTTGSFDAFVTKFNPQGSALVYSTYLGGTADVDRGWAIAVDSAGSAYVAGDTKSTNFPTANPIQGAYGGGLGDAFVTKLNASGSALVYSTFLGGSLTDEGRGIALNGSGAAFTTGLTSSDNFPTANPVQGSNGGGLNNHDDAFVVKIGAAQATTLSSLTLNSTSVTGGTSLQGTVTLSGAAPSGGAAVVLASSNGAAASVPASVTVVAGATTASFSVTTKPVSVSTTVNITATYAGVTKTVTLTVMPPVIADTVTITLARYRLSTKKLAVEATSTSATATLKVYVTATGQLIGKLTNNGGGKYSGRFLWPSNPQKITVRSSLGGSASKSVTLR